MRVGTLAWQLMSSDLRAQSRESLLGVAWHLVLPFVIALVCVGLRAQGVLGGGETQGLAYALSVAAGFALWQAFADALMAPCDAVHDGRELLAKAAFPRAALLYARLGRIALELMLKLVVTALLLLPLGSAPLGVLLAPLAAMPLLLFGSALGLALAPFLVVLRDLRSAFRRLLTAWLLVTPVAYEAPTGWLAQAMAWNPMAPSLSFARDTLVSGPRALPASVLVTTAVALVVLALGVRVFDLAVPHFIERLGN